MFDTTETCCPAATGIDTCRSNPSLVPIYTSWDDYWKNDYMERKQIQQQIQRVDLLTKSGCCCCMEMFDDATVTNNRYCVNRNANRKDDVNNNSNNLSCAHYLHKCSLRHRSFQEGKRSLNNSPFSKNNNKTLLVLNVVVNNNDDDAVHDDDFDKDDESFFKQTTQLMHTNSLSNTSNNSSGKNDATSQTTAENESNCNNVPDLVIVSIPLNELESRRFELPPRNVPFVVCTTTIRTKSSRCSNDDTNLKKCGCDECLKHLITRSKYSTDENQKTVFSESNSFRYHHSDLDSFKPYENCSIVRQIQMLLLGSIVPIIRSNYDGNDDEITSCKSVPTINHETTQTTTTKPWHVKCFIFLHNSQYYYHHCHRTCTSCPTDSNMDLSQKQIITRTTSILPLPRLWNPDTMVSNALLPLLLEIIKNEDEHDHCQHQHHQQQPRKEIWDLGSGVGRDVCYLAEEIKKYQLSHDYQKLRTSSSSCMRLNSNCSNVLVQVVGYDQRYRPNSAAIQETLQFWARRNVREYTDCRLWQFSSSSSSSTKIIRNSNSNSNNNKMKKKQCQKKPFISTTTTTTTKMQEATVTMATTNGGGGDDDDAAAAAAAAAVVPKKKKENVTSWLLSLSSAALSSSILQHDQSIDTIEQLLYGIQQYNVMCIYSVRFWNRSLFHAIATLVSPTTTTTSSSPSPSPPPTNGFVLPNGFVVAISHFCKPDSHGKWMFTNPKEKHVLERTELYDLFTNINRRSGDDTNSNDKKDETNNNNGGTWTILWDKIVSEYDENDVNDDDNDEINCKYCSKNNQTNIHDGKDLEEWQHGHDGHDNDGKDYIHSDTKTNNATGSGRTLVQFVVQWRNKQKG